MILLYIISFIIAAILKSRYVDKKYDSWVGVWLYYGCNVVFTPILGIPFFKMLRGSIFEGPYSRIYNSEKRVDFAYNGNKKDPSLVKKLFILLGICFLVYACLAVAEIIVLESIGKSAIIEANRSFFVLTNLFVSVVITILLRYRK